MRIDLSTNTTPAHALQIQTKSLGDHSYIVVVGDEAAAIDIQRDLDRFEDVLADLDASLVAVFETHIHNDYVSGGKRLAEAHEATYVLPADSGATYEHMPLPDGESIPVGPWKLTAMHTPGHTFTHTSYVLESPEAPVAIFSGGSMLVGAVGRSDLLGADHTDVLLDHQYASAHRIADGVPDPALVAPTHGSGSFCSASAVSDSTSTVGLERQRNPALLAPDAAIFAAGQKAGYLEYPTYYAHMAPANLQPLGAPPGTGLAPISDLATVRDATLVDVRTFEEYAGGHLAGSLSFPASRDAAVYLGWLLEWNSPVVLIGADDAVALVRRDLSRIGWDNVTGRIEPGELGRLSDSPLSTTTWMRWAGYTPGRATTVDVRDRIEQESGVIPGAATVHLSEFARNTAAYVNGDCVIHCQSGYRAAIAAGFAEAAGANVAVVRDDMSRVSVDLISPG